MFYGHANKAQVLLLLCATKAGKQTLGFVRGILHSMSHVSTDQCGPIASSLSAFISKILYPLVSHRHPLIFVLPTILDLS